MSGESKKYKRYLDLCNSEERQLLWRFYHKKTIFDILEVARKENQHSSFISWLLNPYESHGMGDFPMKRFLETLCLAYLNYGQDYLTLENPTFMTSDRQQTLRERLLFFPEAAEPKEKTDLRKKLMQGDYRISACNIWREKVLTAKRRIDIYIELFLQIETKPYRILLLIENKVRSGENDKQTDNYLKDLLEESDKKPENDKETESNKETENNRETKNNKETVFIVPIFLTPATNSETKSNAKLLFDKNANNKKLPCGNRLFLLLNYQYLMDGVLSPCRTAFQGERIYDILTDYVSCLGKSIDDAKNTAAELPVSIMAISREEKEWSRRLWENHQDTLRIICQELRGATDERLVAQNPSNLQFYRTVLSVILLQKEELGIEGQTESDLQDALKTSQRAEYSVKQQNGALWNFVSGNHGNKSLGALAYVILRQYIIHSDENKNESAEDILSKLKEIKHSWLRNVLITKKDLVQLFEDGRGQYLRKGNLPACQCQNSKNDTWTGCPLDKLNAKIDKNQDKELLQQKDCPLYPELSNRELLERCYVPNKGRICACLYEVADHFFVKDLGKAIKEAFLEKNGVDASWAFEEPIFQNENMNQTFGAIPVGVQGEDFVFVARFWSVNTIEILLDALKMQKYVGKGTDESKENLGFMIEAL